ncbi:hypothetical protein BRADI_3g23093v3 [Brachypodium distachyon]|uniref:Uncharacterized protein n=1 Tax=Brachypodium distachyon TaxID=15368 RepID=A0A2K2CYZ0_BRADI|nr:hypothetical protein BRADI_3g23093v3 [Brachypodium distachyon]PNT67243.1 hypothetical protein BRADI_3g23093v3 [Brachypodium distachyon]
MGSTTTRARKEKNSTPTTKIVWSVIIVVAKSARTTTTLDKEAPMTSKMYVLLVWVTGLYSNMLSPWC